MGRRKYLFILFFLPCLVQAKISLKDYLSQIQSSNGDYQSAELGVRSAKEKSDGPSLLFSPNLLSGVQYYQDLRLPSNPLAGKSTKYSQINLGIAKTSPLGFTWKVSDGLSYTSVAGASPLFISVPQYYEHIPKIEFEIPLWRNFGGREWEYLSNAQKKEIEVESISQEFRMKMVLLEAESIFFQLLNLRKSIHIQESMIAQTMLLNDWVARRVQNDLTDRADLFETGSALKWRKLELENSRMTEQELARKFNALRGESPEVSVGELDEAGLPNATADILPVVKDSRGDFRAKEVGVEMQRYLHQQSIEKFKPDIKAYLQTSFNGKDKMLNDAIKDGAQLKHPEWTVGINMVLPLDREVISSVTSGHKTAIMSAESMLHQSRENLKDERKTILSKLDNLAAQIQQVIDLENSEKSKVEYERERLKKGKTTTYQLIVNEGSWSRARLKHIELVSNWQTLRSKLKLFDLLENQKQE